jgi:hypothetical protein
MASCHYKNFLIVVYAVFDQVRALWTMTVDVSWDCVTDHHGYRLLDHPDRSFEAEDEAEQWGFEIGKEWVDKRWFLAH